MKKFALFLVVLLCVGCDKVATVADSDAMRLWVWVQCTSTSDLNAVADDYLRSLTPQDGEPALTFGTDCDYLLVDFFDTEFRFRRETGRFPAYDDEEAWLARLDKATCEHFARRVYQTDMTDWDETWGEANLAAVAKLSDRKFASAMRKIYRGYIECMQKNADETVHFLGYSNRTTADDHFAFGVYDLLYSVNNDFYVRLWFVQHDDGTYERAVRDTGPSLYDVLK